jgi:ABC-type dipeptide/oligopeptide/nickel transport system permease component
MTVVVAFITGMTLGIVGALKQNTWLDYLTTLVSIFGVVTPNFVLGITLVLLFSTVADWLPVGGWEGPKYWVLPVVCFALGPMGVIARFTRTSLLDVMREDYVRTARAKGVRETWVVFRHMLRNALVPILTIVGPMAGALTTGSIYVEAIFRVPGIGKFFTSSIQARDYPMILAITRFYAVIVAVSYLLTDISYVIADPRVDFA